MGIHSFPDTHTAQQQRPGCEVERFRHICWQQRGKYKAMHKGISSLNVWNDVMRRSLEMEGRQEHIHSEPQTLMKQSNFPLCRPSSEQVILFLTSPSPKLQSSAQGFPCSSWISKWEGSVLCKLGEANRLHTRHDAGWGAPFADYRRRRDDGK